MRGWLGKSRLSGNGSPSGKLFNGAERLLFADILYNRVRKYARYCEKLSGVSYGSLSATFYNYNLDDISVQIREENEQLTEYLKRLLEVMEYDVPYTSNALMNKLGLKSKEGFCRNYLRPAIDMDLIRMTIPDKPNSRNQRYVRE